VLEKNKATVPQSFDSFNSVIHSLALREIHMKGEIYAWSNKQRNPTLENLDRVPMSANWEQLFPLTTIRKVVKDQ
jgi:hypothetical protein